jgi:class I fructose-bisphosphate aldolase
LIIQAGMFTADDRVRELIATPEEAVRLGADALAVAIGVRGPYEGNYLRWLSDSVAAAAKVEMPVVAHIYPRDYSGEVPVIRFVPDEIAWAVRCGVETGVDVIKVAIRATWPRSPKLLHQHQCPWLSPVARVPNRSTKD